MGVWYTTRERVKAAVDIKESARANAQIDRMIEDASRSIDRLCHREFFPWTGTRYFDWPDRNSPTPWRLWLGRNEIVTLSEVTGAGTAIPLDSVFLEPSDAGPPYNRLELDRSATSSFDTGNTPQRNIALTGVFAGAPVTETMAGMENGALDDVADVIFVSDGSLIGVGALLRVDDERMIVVGRAVSDDADGAIDTGGALSAQLNDNAILYAGNDLFPGEVILIGAERMLVTDVAGSTVAVTRAWDGSVLAPHLEAAEIFTYRKLTVQRGVLGTTAAAHSHHDVIRVWNPPGPVEGLCVAKTLVALAQEGSQYARVIGSGENQREARGSGLKEKCAEVYNQYGRKARVGAI